MVSKKSWDKFKRDVEDLTKTGVDLRESWGRKSTNREQNAGHSRKHRMSAPSCAFQVHDDERDDDDDDIEGFSSSDNDEPKKINLSVSKRALCYSAPVKTRKRLKKHDTPDIKDATTPVTRFHWKSFDSLRNRQLDGGSKKRKTDGGCNKLPKPDGGCNKLPKPDGGSNKSKVVSSNFESSFTASSTLLAFPPENSCLSSANLSNSKSKDVIEKINEDISWSDSEGDSEGDTECEEPILGLHTESHKIITNNKIPFSSQQMDLSEVKVNTKPLGDIDEFDSDSEERQLTLGDASDKESVPSISPNTPTPTPTSPPKIAEGGAPLDSAKKRKPKYLRSGLAEKLRKLILRENSERSFWSHKLRQLKEGREDDEQSSRQADGSVTLRVVSDDLDHSVYVIKCDVISQDVISERQLPDRVIILLDNEGRKQLLFKSKPSYLRIYSPWKIFDLPNSCLPVLLAITRCEVLPSLDPSQLQVASSSMIVEEPAFSSTKQADQSLTKVVRTKLFSAFDVSTDEVNDEQEDDSGEELAKKPSEYFASFSTSLLGDLGLQGQCLKGSFNLTARIQRVYWRDIETRDQKLNCTSSLVTSVVERSKVLKRKNNTSLCFLAQDSAGFCSEIRVSSDVLLKRAEWQELLCTAEGSVMSCRGLRLVEHRKRKRRPGLFGLIDSLSVAYKEGLATDMLCERGTGKQTVCFSLWTDEETVLQRLSEDEAIDCVPYYPSKALTLNDLRTNSALNLVNFYGQLLHATSNSDQRYDTKHVRLFISGRFVANESSGDVLDSSNEIVSAPVIQVRHSSRTGIIGCDESTLTAGQLLYIQDVVIERVSPTVLTADGFSKIQVLIPQSTFSTRSSTPALHVDDLWRKMTSVAMDDGKYSHLRRVSRAILPELNEEIESGSLVTFEGIIIDVDQANAFCWFTCNECGSDDISELQENSLYICNSCALDIRCPVTNTHLEIYLKSISSPELRVKAKLLQSTISRLLPVGDNNEGYDVQCVLNKRLGPISCYVFAKLDEQDSREDSQINFKLEELDDSSWTQ